MTKPIIFLGSSSQVEIPAEVCWRKDIPIAGIIDSDYHGNTEHITDIPIIGSEKTADWDKLKKDHDFFIVTNPIPGWPRNIIRRKMFMDIVEQYDLPCATLIDPAARVGRRATIGKGVFVGFSAIVNSGVTVGDHCQIQALSAVAHDSILGKNVIVQRMALVVGDVEVGDNAYIGLGARCCKVGGMKIGANSFVHPGVIVMRDVEEGETVSLTGKNTRRVYNTVAINDDDDQPWLS